MDGCDQFMKWTLFLFNFIVWLSGVAIVSIAALGMKNILPPMEGIDLPFIQNSSWTLIVVGSIIFIIAFLGCCGAIRESHWMSVTYAILLLTLLVVQVAVAIYLIVNVKDIKQDLTNQLKHFVETYDSNKGSQTILNDVQTWAKCCGANGYKDYNDYVPGSCCGKANNNRCTIGSDDIYKNGCGPVLNDAIQKYGNYIGIAAICLGAAELFGVIFSLCLANSIKNKHRRGYEV